MAGRLNLKVLVKPESLQMPNGKFVHLKPIIESLKKETLPACISQVQEKMGVSLPSTTISVQLIDSKNFAKLPGNSPVNPDPGCISVENRTIYFNSEKILETTMNDIPAPIGESQEAYISAIFQLHFSIGYVHEFAHFVHLMLQPDKWEGIVKWNNGEGKKTLRKQFEVYKSLIMAEGIACWTTKKVIDRWFEPQDEQDTITYRNVSEKFTGRPPTFMEKILGIVRGDKAHSLGHWYMRQVELLTGQNPVTLILDSFPSVSEFLYPKKYVKRLQNEAKL